MTTKAEQPPVTSAAFILKIGTALLIMFVATSSPQELTGGALLAATTVGPDSTHALEPSLRWR